MENYNQYRESLNIDCSCNDVKNKTPKNDNCGCGGVDMQSKDNTIEILIKQLQREVKELMEKTQSKLLCQDKQIAECCTYIKNNLSNYIRELIDSMKLSGELDEIIKSVLTNSLTIMGIGYNDYRCKQTKTYEDINYSNISYNHYTNSNDFYVNENGIWIKSHYKKNLVINMSTNVRADSGKEGYRYCRIELWRNGVLVNSEFSAVYLYNGTDRQNISIPTFFKCTYNDCIKIKVYGEINDSFILTRLNLSLYKNNDNTYYEGF